MTIDSRRSAYDDFADRRHFESLDGLRAISVIGVIWHHTAASVHKGSAWGYLGAQGVTFFFAISGFLITTLLLREAARHGGSIDLKAFYIRRSLRIFPLYYAVLLLYVILVWSLERHSASGQEFFNNLPYFVTYTSNWFVELDGRVIFYFAWSLAAEEQFYLLWPPVMVLLMKDQRYRWFAGALACLSLAFGLTAWAGIDPGVLAPLSRVFEEIPLAIIGGVCLALVLHERASFERCERLFAGHWLSVVWLILVAVALWTPAWPPLVLQLAMVGLVGACVVPASHALSRALNARWIVHVGAVSYGLYLLHMLVKNAVSKVLIRLGDSPPNAYLEFALTCVLGLAVATLSYRYFEAPVLRLKHRFER